MNPDALWLGIISLIVTIVYVGDHLRFAFRKWQRERRRVPRAWEEPLRSFRNLFIAVMLALGFIRIDIGAFARAFPTDLGLKVSQDVMAPILTLFLLAGAIVTSYTWRKEEGEWPFKPRK